MELVELRLRMAVDGGSLDRRPIGDGDLLRRPLGCGV